MLDEINTRERRIDNGWPVGISARCERVALRDEGSDNAAAGIAGRKAAADRPLQLIPGDDLRDLEKSWNIAVAQSHDVEQGLLLPRIADRVAVIDAVARDGGRP